MLPEKAKSTKSSAVFVEVTDENGIPLLFTFEASFDYRGGFVKQHFIKWDLLKEDRDYIIHFYVKKPDEQTAICAMRSLFESMEHLSHASKYNKIIIQSILKSRDHFIFIISTNCLLTRVV